LVDGMEKVMAQTANYGEGTNILCKACGKRKIFVRGPVEISTEDGKRYLVLTCPNAACNQTRRYEESELEIR